MGQDRGLWFPKQSLRSLSSLAKKDPNLISKTRGGTTDMFSTLGSHGWVHGFMGECTQKKFLVFDQSRDKTTLLLTSDIRRSLESQKQPDMKEELRRSNKDLVVCQGMPGNSQPDSQSEKQEDTEELNALLYSEDESDCYSEEDEVTSTESAYGDQETFLESHAKKRKVLESFNEDTLDAESSCGGGGCGNTRIGFRKRSKPSSDKIVEEKIFETVSLLRSIVVPGEELLDPILVIDRAIDYLKSLKMEAENRGHGTLRLQDT